MQNTATTSVRHHVNEQQPTAVESPEGESNAATSSGNHFYAGAATSDFHCDYFGTSPRGASPGDYHKKETVIVIVTKMHCPGMTGSYHQLTVILRKFLVWSPSK